MTKRCAFLAILLTIPYGHAELRTVPVEVVVPGGPTRRRAARAVRSPITLR